MTRGAPALGDRTFITDGGLETVLIFHEGAGLPGFAAFVLLDDARLRGVRANASKPSRAELDAAEELDDGDPAELAVSYVELRERLPALSVVGGCCGTDHRHVEAIARAFTR